MPKLPPPPRRPQNSSGSLSASTRSRSTVGGDEVDGAQVVDGEPVLAHEVPEPAAERQPADPDVTDRPAGGGQAVALGGEVELRPHQAAGGPRDARAPGSTETAFICERSIITPSSQTEWPTTEWPPPRTESGSSRSRANRSACWTSSAPAQRAIRAGRRSMAPFQIRRASS